MDLAGDLDKELEATAQEVLGKLRSRELFQSTWDTAAFIIFLIFLGEFGLGPWPPPPPVLVLAEDHIWTPVLPAGTVLLLLLLVCIHCCCCSCCSRPASRHQKVSLEQVSPTCPLGWAGARGSLELHWGEEGAGTPVERGRQGTHK